MAAEIAELETQIITIVQNTLRGNLGDDSITVDSSSSMDTVNGWDSMQFLAVYETVNEQMGISPDFDDAFHYTSIAGMTQFIAGELAI